MSNSTEGSVNGKKLVRIRTSRGPKIALVKSSIVPRLNEFDFFWPGHPRVSSKSDFTFRLDDEILDAKLEAVKAHASQMELLFEAYGDDFFRSILSTEVYGHGTRSNFGARVLLDLKQA